MIYYTPATLAQKIDEMAWKSITGIASLVKREHLMWIATQIVNSSPYMPMDTTESRIKQLLTGLADKFPEKFEADCFPND
jgi:hypothetical protein